MKLPAYGGTTTSGTQSWKNMTTMAKVDTSDLMITRWVMNIYSRSPKLEWDSIAHITPHIVKKIRKVPARTINTLDTLSTEYTQQVFTHTSGIFHLMCSMQVSKLCMMIRRGSSSMQNTTLMLLCILPTAHIIDCTLSEEIKSSIISSPVPSS